MEIEKGEENKKKKKIGLTYAHDYQTSKGPLIIWMDLVTSLFKSNGIRSKLEFNTLFVIESFKLDSIWVLSFWN